MANVDDTITDASELYEHLQRYIRWLASMRATDEVLMSADELEGELSLELVKGWLYYKEADLSSGEMLAVVRKILDNRVGELKYRFYRTHRSRSVDVLDIDDDAVAGTIPDSVPSPEDFCMSDDRLTTLMRMLAPVEQEIVRAVLQQDDRIRQALTIRSWRATFVYDNVHISIDSRVVSEALHIDHAVVRQAWNSISEAIRRVYG